MTDGKKSPVAFLVAGLVVYVERRAIVVAGGRRRRGRLAMGAVPRSLVQCRMPTLICLFLGTGRRTRDRDSRTRLGSSSTGGWTRRSRTGGLTGLAAQVDQGAAPYQDDEAFREIFVPSILH